MKSRKGWTLVIFLEAVLLIFEHGCVRHVLCTLQIASIDEDAIVAQVPFSCDTRPDGTYPDVSTNCTVYYRCLKGVALSHRCQNGSMYDVISGECVSPSSELCADAAPNPFSATCVGKPDGIYIDYKSQCHNYYRCDSGIKIDFTCGQHMVFELRSASCIDSNLTSCHAPSCAGRPDGYYPVPDSDARLFYSCESETISTMFSCSSDKSFDTTLAACRTLPFASSLLPDCSDKPDRFYPDVSSSCQRVYQCQSEQIVSYFNCSPGYAFDAVAQRCREKHHVPCIAAASEELFVATCQNKVDGYYPEFASGCKSFYYCLGGEKMWNITCPEGQLFNNHLEKCDVASNVVCSASMLLALHHFCASKSDGFYPNPVTGCKSYIYCENGRISSEITCPKGKVFNVTIKDCSSSSSSTAIDGALCSEILLVEDCSGKPDGYHPSYSMGCQKYFYCGGRRKLLEFQCPKGQLFHPVKKQCMNASRVNCEPNGFSPECTARVDGYYPNLASGCRKFYYCRSGYKVNELSCPSGQIFDVAAQACTQLDSMACVPSVDCRSDGFFGDQTKGCRSYYFCSQNKKQGEFRCPPGKSYDFEARTCMNEADARCQASYSLDNSNCSGKNNGFYSLTPADYIGVEKFYLCLNGRLTAALDCPPGAVFDDQRLRCVAKNASSNCIGDFCCNGFPNGFYVMNGTGDLSVFYSCFQNTLTVHRCPQNTSFNWQTISCDDQTTSVDVPIPDPQCHGKTDGLYEVVEKYFSVFVLCIEQVMSVVGLCPFDYGFSQERGECVPGRNLSLAQENAKPITAWECLGKENRYYADRSTNCTQYYFCRNQTVVRMNACPRNEIYDEGKQACLKSSYQICPISNQTQKGFRTRYLQKFDSTLHVNKYSTVASVKASQPATAVHKQKGSTFFKDRAGRDPMAYGLLSKSTRSDYYEFGTYRFLQPLSTVRTFVVSESATAPPPIPTNKFVLGDRDCQGKMNGIFPDFTANCRQFYVCFREVKMLFSCSGDRLFNPETNTCDAAKDVLCQPHSSLAPAGPTNDVRRVDALENYHRPAFTGSRYNEKFACLPYETGFFPEFTSGCRDFYVCFRGIQKIYSCPDGLLFSPATKSCDVPSNVNCTSLAISGSSNGSIKTRTGEPQFPFEDIPGTEATTLATVKCEDNSSSVHVDFESGCQRYAMCQDGVKKWVMCSNDWRFDVGLRQCRPPEEVACSEENLNGSGPAPKSEGGTLTELSSPKSISEPSTVAPPFDCSKVADGFYPDYLRHCHVFYRCLRGRKLSYYCKVGQLFNPVTELCDFEDNVVCHP